MTWLSVNQLILYKRKKLLQVFVFMMHIITGKCREVIPQSGLSGIRTLVPIHLKSFDCSDTQVCWDRQTPI